MNIKCPLPAATALLSAFLVASAIVPAQAATCTSPGTCGTATRQGDVNLDGSVSPVDVVYLVNYTLKASPPPLAPLCNMELNGYCNPGSSPAFDCQPTLGDVVALVDYVYRGLNVFKPCGSAGQVPSGKLRLRFRTFIRVPPGTGTIPVSFQIKNTDPISPKNLRGFSTPIEFTGATGVTITGLNVPFIYNAGGLFMADWMARATNRVMVWAYSQGGQTVAIPPRGAINPVITVDVSYTNSTGSSQPILITQYQQPPADINLIHTTTIFLERGEMQGETVEESILEYEDDTNEVPATGAAGRIALLILVGMVGAAAVTLFARRYRTA